MLKNLPELTSQLREFAEVINSFKSEAVQLKIVEMVLAGRVPTVTVATPPAATNGSATPAAEAAPARRRKRRKAGNGDASNTTNVALKTSGRPGPKAMLERLIAEQFFSEPRTASSIIDHCGNKMAHKYRQNEIAVTLTRLTREKKLEREKNGEGQYTYSAK